jgi:hypothetical protein
MTAGYVLAGHQLQRRSTLKAKEGDMPEVSYGGTGKTLYLKLSIFPCGGADPNKNLTISCSDKDTQFKTTLSDQGLQKFKQQILAFTAVPTLMLDDGLTF